jgi:hypothetical protein
MPPIEQLQRVPVLLLERLERQGVFTTGLLLEVSETRTRRVYLADQIGVTTNDIDDWRDEALLLNLAAFGPTEQRILTQAGITGIDGVLELDLPTFRERVGSAARTLDLPVPTDLAIAGWYGQAHTLVE